MTTIRPAFVGILIGAFMSVPMLLTAVHVSDSLAEMREMEDRLAAIEASY